MSAPTPRAVRHFGLAAMEARAARTRQAVEPVPRPRPAPPARRFVLRLWLPATPIFLLLAPFAILAIPLLYLAPFRRVNWAAAVFRLGDALLALGGTDVLVDTPEALVRIRLF
jgi:hypothetical protein